jgi:hypothetical protein
MNRRATLWLSIALGAAVLACGPAASVQTQPAPAPTLGAQPAAPAATHAPTARPRPTSTPHPTPVPEELVWLAPNMGSTDYVELFTRPDDWSLARSQIDVFKFYTQNLLPDACDICAENILPAFVEVDAFRKLSDWGIGIAAEVGAVKPWGCTSDVTFGVAQQVIHNVQVNGGQVAFLALDEPRVGGEESPDGLTCAYGMEDSARETAAFIRRVRSTYPEIVVGDIEAYPHFPVSEIERWLESLEAQQAKPAFLHMDIDLERVRVERADVSGALVEMQRFCNEHGIAFGVILTSNWREAGSNRAYYESVMGWIRTVRDAIGRPAHVVFQSWQGPAPSGAHEVPVNLPQNDPENYSHIRLVRYGLELFGGD